MLSPEEMQLPHTGAHTRTIHAYNTGYPMRPCSRFRATSMPKRPSQREAWTGKPAAQPPVHPPAVGDRVPNRIKNPGPHHVPFRCKSWSNRSMEKTASFIPAARASQLQRRTELIPPSQSRCKNRTNLGGSRAIRMTRKNQPASFTFVIACLQQTLSSPRSLLAKQSDQYRPSRLLKKSYEMNNHGRGSV